MRTKWTAVALTACLTSCGDVAPGDGRLPDAGSDGRSRSDSADDSTCDLGGNCTPLGAHCVVKGAGPCGSDERLVCGAAGTFFFDGYPCGPLDCDSIADGPTSYEEKCGCDGAQMVCHGNDPGTGQIANCNGGGCLVTLASGQVFVGAIAVDANDIYWTDQERGVVLKMPQVGGSPTTLAANSPTPSGIVLDDTSVYWTEARGDIGGYLVRASKAGGAATTLASGQVAPYAVTVDATYVYSIGSATIIKVPIAGGSVTTLAHGNLNANGLALSGADVVFTSNGPGGSILKVPSAGGAVTTLATGQTNPYGVAADAKNVYWASDGKIRAVPTVGGAVTTLTAGTGGALAIAVDEYAVYWTDNDQYVKAVSLKGGDVFTVASGQAMPFALTVGATGVYFSTGVNGTGALLEATPK